MFQKCKPSRFTALQCMVRTFVQYFQNKIILSRSVSALKIVLFNKKRCVFIKYPFSCGFRYGIGMIYYKQEKFSLAELHFRKALSINPQSSVLMCHVGAVSLKVTHNYTVQVITSKFKKKICKDALRYSFWYLLYL